MRLIICLYIITALFSCSQKKPDVSNIKINLTTHRFEKDLFALDTNNITWQLDQMLAKYPSFEETFLSDILNTDPKWRADTASAYIKGFITAYRHVYDSSQKVFADFTPYENQIKSGLQYLNYYFPAYKAPKNIITYIGPIDGYGDILSDDALIIGLQAHMGSNFSMYRLPWVQEVYAAYITNRFEPAYIPINCMKIIVNDMYPEKNEDATMITQMVESGKRIFMLSKLLPEVPGHMLIGYTEKQLKDSYAHEAQVWQMLVQNNLLQSIDNNVIKNYIGESPKTQELGEGSPGNIGSFAGWQIIKKYMDKKPETSVSALLAIPADSIFTVAKYKP